MVISLELPVSQATLRATNGNGSVYTTHGLLVKPDDLAATPARERRARHDACGDGQVRCFSPVLYAINTVVPLISLDQRITWYPDPHVSGGQLMLWWAPTSPPCSAGYCPRSSSCPWPGCPAARDGRARVSPADRAGRRLKMAAAARQIPHRPGIGHSFLVPFSPVSGHPGQ